MLRSILSAIGAGLMAAFRFTGRVLTAPLTWFGGSGQAAPEPVPMPEPLVAGETHDATEIYDDIARVVMSWCADCIIADEPVPLPPGMPIALREWLPGLTRDECWGVMDADVLAVSSHLQRCFALPGVRPVQPLLRSDGWPAEPVRPESAGFAAIAALEAIEPARA